jgi:hypothetical protein
LNFKGYETIVQKLDNRQSNYKQQVLEHIHSIGSDTKQGICEITLKPKNNNVQSECKYYMSVPVWEVLTKYGLIVIDKKTKIVSCSIPMTKAQNEKIVAICQETLRN